MIYSLWIIKYRVILVDSSFDYHLNLFSNVIVLYSVNDTTTKFYNAVYDYTGLANTYGYKYNSFTPIGASDYSQNIIVVFISCI